MKADNQPAIIKTAEQSVLGCSVGSLQRQRKAQDIERRNYRGNVNS